MQRRVVITGIGLMTPVGIGTTATWRALLDGRSGIGPITQFDASALECRIAGEVKDFDVGRYVPDHDARAMDRFIHLALAAGHQAVEAAGLATTEFGTRAGCYLGVGMGGARLIELTIGAAITRGAKFGIKPWFIPAILPNMAAAALAQRFDIRGPVLCHATACASGAHAIGEAVRAIQRGDADIVLAGGAESTINSVSVGGFANLRVLSRRNDHPEHASRPFDRDRDGFVIAEGAGVLVLEALAHARARGATIYAEVRGFGLSSDATHPTAPAPGGEGASRAMEMALRDAKLPADAIQYINAHGTGTRVNDVSETTAIKRTFGSAARRLMVSSTKSMTGHMLGGAGAVEAAICALACAHGQIPPTINLQTADPACDLDYVPNHARELDVAASMSNSFGFGGVNASLVFTHHA